MGLRDPLLRKQRTDTLLGISQQRSPQRQHIFNRRATNHQIPNHGRPWIQNLQENATVSLSRFVFSVLGAGMDFEGRSSAERFGPMSIGLWG